MDKAFRTCGLVLFVAACQFAALHNAWAIGEHVFTWSSSSGMRDLGRGDDINAYRINGLGQVVGRRVMWNSDGTQSLWPVDPLLSTLYDISDCGRIVGSHDFVAHNLSQRRAVMWDPDSGAAELGTLSGGYDSYALAVSHNGAFLVGGSNYSSYGFIYSHPVIWDQVNGLRDLWNLGCTMQAAVAVNDAGQVAGYELNGQSIAMVWDSVNGKRSLGSLGGSSSYAADINNSGSVVGRSKTADGETHAFVWTAASGLRDLGTLGGTDSTAQAINDLGQVVGASRTANGNMHAFIWDEVAGMRDLGTLGGATSFGCDINDNGYVVGYSMVPEPAAYVSLLTGAALLVLGLLRRRVPAARAGIAQMK